MPTVAAASRPIRPLSATYDDEGDKTVQRHRSTARFNGTGFNVTAVA
ncbi:hypothetical protein [Arthrobacter sp. 92]